MQRSPSPAVWQQDAGMMRSGLIRSCRVMSCVPWICADTYGTIYPRVSRCGGGGEVAAEVTGALFGSVVVFGRGRYLARPPGVADNVAVKLDCLCRRCPCRPGRG